MLQVQPNTRSLVPTNYFKNLFKVTPYCSISLCLCALTKLTSGVTEITAPGKIPLQEKMRYHQAYESTLYYYSIFLFGFDYKPVLI